MNVRATPDQVYAELFHAVQSTHLLGDSKTFVDAVAKAEPQLVVEAFRRERDQPGFDLRRFVDEYFELPETLAEAAPESRNGGIEARVEQLWDYLTRGPDTAVPHSSLIPLPNRYLVPGGRFREVYYWDSYFTMLGLADSGRIDLIRDMVENFAWLIDQIGFIPNGNRTYYCTRSQPPFFALMVDLLVETSRDERLYARFLPQLQAEYRFWMAGTDTLGTGRTANRRVVSAPGGLLNRYWDDAASPRPESYAEDTGLASIAGRDAATLFRDVRAGAESGWDYSSRWLGADCSMATIRTTQIIPVDLNALIYNLEATLARICRLCGREDEASVYDSHARLRKKLLQLHLFDADAGMFVDLVLPDFAPSGRLSLAAVYPLFFGIATDEQADSVAKRVHREFLKAGGWTTTNEESGQQWDSPNGWAPLQWMTYVGLCRYGYRDEAEEGARRWVANNLAVYRQHGRLLEKYNVATPGLAGTGGEYEVQDGFGWTNAVLLRLLKETQ